MGGKGQWQGTHTSMEKVFVLKPYVSVNMSRRGKGKEKKKYITLQFHLHICFV